MVLRTVPRIVLRAMDNYVGAVFSPTGVRSGADKRTIGSRDTAQDEQTIAIRRPCKGDCLTADPITRSLLRGRFSATSEVTAFRDPLSGIITLFRASELY